MGDSNGALCAARNGYVLNEQSGKADQSNNLLDEIDIVFTRFIASPTDILRRPPFIDVDADESPAFMVGVGGGVVVFSGNVRVAGVWFVLLLILLVSCNTSGEEE